MQMDQVKQNINRIEECVDEAQRAVQSGSVPSEVKQCVEQMHQQARQAKQSVNSGDQQQAGEDAVRQQVMQLEQTGDRAMQACRTAGGSLDPQTQQAIKRAHDEISSLKKQIQMG